MVGFPASQKITSQGSWVSYLASYLLIFITVVRKCTYHYPYRSFTDAVALLGVFLLLYMSEPRLSRRFGWYPRVYFLVQAGIVLALGLLRPYEDTWGILYLALGFQVVYACSRREIIVWSILFAASMILTMMVTLGWVFGLGLSLFLIAAGIFFISFDFLYVQSDAARQESQKLLEEVQAAHHKLKEYAGQVEELAAAQERNRLAYELHDSVSQMIFSITLNAQATRMLIDRDPHRVPEKLEQLQELTGQALSQMRALISQWRPG